MWAAIAGGAYAGTWSTVNWIVLGLCFTACTIVFRNFVQVFSYGYGASLAVASLYVLWVKPSLAAMLICGLGVAYGIRLCWFVYRRDVGESYASRRVASEKGTARIPLAARIGIWVPVSTLMAFEAMPAWVVARDGALSPALMTGAIIMAAGLVLEAIADGQKQRAKDRDPEGFVSVGLYQHARHPNYAGEILFQFGLMIAPLGVLLPWHERAMVLLAPAYIIVLMYYAGRSGDERQAGRLAGRPDYADYLARTGRFAPFL
jgi:steroid 5-alpha reductase family enzyme